MIKLLAIDMDGTCLNDKKVISEENLAALRHAAQAGILVVPTTGRALQNLPHQLPTETFYRYVISSNGAVVTDIQTGERLYEAQIPCEEAVKLLKKCDEQRLGISIHMKDQFILQGHLLRLIGKLSYRKDAATTVVVKDMAEFLQQEQSDVEEIQLFHFTDKERERARTLLAGYDHLAKAGADYYVELYSKQASKGNALAALGKHLQIPTQDIACIGDAENDFSMFEASGHKFAMGNGIPQLKDRADTVLPDNNENGVAYAIEQILLAP